ncbi:hypothetical protein HBB16_15200 [Pseudonocardia sp. MCCB 268]|nr:hypothetical protein [Pseudonocardia cytotoxica]
MLFRGHLVTLDRPGQQPVGPRPRHRPAGVSWLAHRGAAVRQHDRDAGVGRPAGDRPVRTCPRTARPP